SYSTITGQLRNSYSTVTVQLQHSYSTVTVQLLSKAGYKLCSRVFWGIREAPGFSREDGSRRGRINGRMNHGCCCCC
uniref:Uncharacterized protein n=1 Tax=Astyanax mexicanus TaxID=7994 RepID=A0A3B1IG65_ASTMX